MKRVVLATRNAGKIREIRQLMRGSGVRFLTAGDFPSLCPPAEDCKTFRGNAARKAREVALQTGYPALAEDSGLEVAALGGRPGVRSARYSGPGASDSKNNAKLLRQLSGVPAGRRTARFRCVAVLAMPDGKTVVRQGSCAGWIGTRPRGRGGFGYDPLFIMAGSDSTFAQLSPAEKSRLSHRGRALRRIRPVVEMLARTGHLPAKPNAGVREANSTRNP